MPVTFLKFKEKLKAQKRKKLNSFFQYTEHTIILVKINENYGRSKMFTCIMEENKKITDGTRYTEKLNTDKWIKRMLKYKKRNGKIMLMLVK